MRGRPIDYSAREMAWLEANRGMVISDYIAGFHAAFPKRRRDVSANNLHGLRKRMRWLVGREASAAKKRGSSTLFTPAQIAWAKANAKMPGDQYAAAFNRRFRTKHAADVLIRLRKRRGWKTGRSGRFEKGAIPHNKGKPCPPGKGGRHPNARRTQFKKGSRSGRAVALYQPIGAERWSKEGYRERKIHDGLPMQSRWRAVHLIRWEELHGAIPAGHCLKCLDGDKGNTDPANWELIDRAILPLLNGRHGLAFKDVPAAFKPTALAAAKLKSAVARAKQKGAKR